MALLSATTICRRWSCLASDIENVNASKRPSRAMLASPNLLGAALPTGLRRRPVYPAAAQAASIAAARTAAVTDASTSVQREFTPHTPCANGRPAPRGGHSFGPNQTLSPAVDVPPARAAGADAARL